jgi:hypothetical protein
MFASDAEDRWEGAWAADQELLRSLKEHGDRPDLVRPIDVTFSGTAEALASLADGAGEFGFEIFERRDAQPGEEPQLVLVRNQAADGDAIRDLARTYLAIEDRFGVDCEGWGCDAQVE